jgi:hypothetical protein
MKKLGLILSLILLTNISISAYGLDIFGNSGDTIKFQINNLGTDIYFKVNQNNYKYVYTIHPISDDSMILVSQIESIFNINFPCEKNFVSCNIFINKQNNYEVSQIFKNVFDVNYTFSNPIVAAEVDTSNTITLSFPPAFGECNKPLIFVFNAYPSSTLRASVGAGFWSNGDFGVDYTDTKGNDVKKLIKIDYDQLFKDCGQKLIKNNEYHIPEDQFTLSTTPKNGTLNYTCNFEANTCDVYVQTNNGKKITIFDSEDYDLVQSRMSFVKYTNSLSAIHVGCGTECYYDTFINMDSGEYSEAFEELIAVDPFNNLVAYPGYGDKQQSIIIANIFKSNYKVIIQRNFSPALTVLDDVTNITFNKNGTLKIDYVTGPDHKEKIEIIPLDYQKLGLISGLVS